MTTDDDAKNGCIAAVAVTLAMPFGALYSAFAYKTVWSWLAVPLFGLQPITMIQAYAGIVLVQYIVWHYDGRIEDKRTVGDRTANSLGWMFLKPTWLLLVGWVARFFV